MKFKCNEGASDAEIMRIDPAIQSILPPDYLAFMRRANGGEGFVGDEYAILWRIEEIGQFNQEYEVREYLTNVVLFGSNGGGEGFGFKGSETAIDVVRVPFIGMSMDSCIKIAESFAAFISQAEL